MRKGKTRLKATLVRRCGIGSEKQEAAMSVLEKLRNRRVFAIEVSGDGYVFYERCDENFGVELTKPEVLQLAEELRGLVNESMDSQNDE